MANLKSTVEPKTKQTFHYLNSDEKIKDENILTSLRYQLVLQNLDIQLDALDRHINTFGRSMKRIEYENLLTVINAIETTHSHLDSFTKEFIANDRLIDEIDSFVDWVNKRR